MEAHMKALRAWLESERDAPIEEMSAFFERRLDGYDAHMLDHWRACYGALAELVPAGALNVLDLGCGTGLELEALWERLPGVRVTGIDLSRPMLDELERKMAHRPLRTVCGDYFRLDLGDGEYDAAITFESLHHFTAEQKSGLYARIRRALRLDGLFVYGDYFACCEDEERILAEECRRKRALARVPDGAFVHFDTPLTVERELALLERAGFRLERHVRFDDSGDISTHILALRRAK